MILAWLGYSAPYLDSGSCFSTKLCERSEASVAWPLPEGGFGVCQLEVCYPKPESISGPAGSGRVSG